MDRKADRAAFSPFFPFFGLDSFFLPLSSLLVCGYIYALVWDRADVCVLRVLLLLLQLRLLLPVVRYFGFCGATIQLVARSWTTLCRVEFDGGV